MRDRFQSDEWREPPRRLGRIEPLEILDTNAGAILSGIVAAMLVIAAIWYWS